jgi:hypothetical protein
VDLQTLLFLNEAKNIFHRLLPKISVINGAAKVVAVNRARSEEAVLQSQRDSHSNGKKP